MMIALPDGANPDRRPTRTIITGALGKKTAIRQTVKTRRAAARLRTGHRPLLQDALLEHRRRGPDHRGRHRRELLRPLLGRTRCPSAVLLLIMGLAGAVAGGIWALIPAFFKAKWNTNETLFHSHDELHHHRRRPLAAGRSVGRPSRLADHPPVRSGRPRCRRSWAFTAAGSSC